MFHTSFPTGPLYDGVEYSGGRRRRGRQHSQIPWRCEVLVEVRTVCTRPALQPPEIDGPLGLPPLNIMQTNSGHP